ncbi:O-antigen polymerase [Enterococcus eurekensis]|uniref:O-antigen polymerase n=1 Tax=Enterococcus eurekensis TaxID=1159753 RepID=A0ABV9M2Y3_9ENTE
MIYLLLIVLLAIVIGSFYLNEYDAISPSFLFSVSITSGVAFATLYVNKWNLTLSMNTFLVVLGGTVTFLLVSYLTKLLFYKKYKLELQKENLELKDYKISNWKLNLFLIFEILVISYTVYSVVILVGGDFQNITSAIVKYRNINMFSDDKIWLPKLLTYSRVAVNAGGFWFSYVLVYKWFAVKKINYRIPVIVFLSMVSSYILGGRNGLINMVVSLVVSYFIVINYKNGFKNNLKAGLLLRLLIIFVLVLISFESLALLIGRSSFSGTSKLDYLAIYIGAPIKNLDSFLQELHGYTRMDQSQTFNHVMNWIGRKFNNPDLLYSLDLPFRTINNQTLGNVYTTFYPYVYDFGYIGVPLMIFIMSFLTQSLYEMVKRGNRQSSLPLIRNITYAYVSNSIVMSFFSNKFYEQHFNTGFIQTIIIWLLFNIFFCTDFLEKVYNNVLFRIKKGDKQS